jgi:predicted RNA-binding Zn-ribbon protein involved in translation (DUF1610 family)
MQQEISARIFGRIKENNSYHSIFICGCGNKSWLSETMDVEKNFTCKACGKNYILRKKQNRRYEIKS